MQLKVSLISSAIRPKIWELFFKSLEGTNVEYEIIFVGNIIMPDGTLEYQLQFPLNFKYITTANIKPAQCYEIARRNAIGETIVWVADDCEFPNDVIGKAYNYWKSQNNEKLIFSIQTKESGYNLPEGKLFNMNMHRFFGDSPAEPYNPLMAPLGMMSREYLEKFGGFDRRYICGQYENDVILRAYADGGNVEIFGDNETYIDIDHLGKSFLAGESTNEKDFLNRPFAKGYSQDRMVLEKSWSTFNARKLINILNTGKNQIFSNEIRDVSKMRLDKFEPYEETDILLKSQSNKGE